MDLSLYDALHQSVDPFFVSGTTKRSPSISSQYVATIKKLISGGKIVLLDIGSGSSVSSGISFRALKVTRESRSLRFLRMAPWPKLSRYANGRTDIQRAETEGGCWQRLAETQDPGVRSITVHSAPSHPASLLLSLTYNERMVASLLASWLIAQKGHSRNLTGWMDSDVGTPRISLNFGWTGARYFYFHALPKSVRCIGRLERIGKSMGSSGSKSKEARSSILPMRCLAQSIGRFVADQADEIGAPGDMEFGDSGGWKTTGFVLQTEGFHSPEERGLDLFQLLPRLNGSIQSQDFRGRSELVRHLCELPSLVFSPEPPQAAHKIAS